MNIRSCHRNIYFFGKNPAANPTTNCIKLNLAAAPHLNVPLALEHQRRKLQVGAASLRACFGLFPDNNIIYALAAAQKLRAIYSAGQIGKKYIRKYL